MTSAVEEHGPVRLIRVSAAPHGILDAAGARNLLAVFESAASDPAARAIIIAGGIPGAFIRHYDLAAIAKAADALRAGAIEPEAFLDADFARLTDGIAAAPVPVIAAINGLCMGGGLEIALACDIRIAQEDVEHIGLPEIRIDIFPGGGGTQRLVRLIGEAAALDMTLCGRTVTARRAYELGLVGELAADAVTAALTLADSLAQRDGGALAAIKRLVRAAQDRPLTTGLADERLAFAGLLATSDQALETIRNTLASGVMLEELEL